MSYLVSREERATGDDRFQQSEFGNSLCWDIRLCEEHCRFQIVSSRDLLDLMNKIDFVAAEIACAELLKL
jgi:hypothetical protein